MSKLSIVRSTTLFIALSGSLLATLQVRANPLTYSISQSGWSSGGVVSGYFSGEDLNHDGYINLASGEVDTYQISFSGNFFVSSFTHTLADLEFFSYTVGSTGFRPSFPLYSCGSGYFYDADDYTIGNCVNGLPILAFNATTTTAENALVSAAVPEPTTMSIVAVGLVVLTGMLRRRRISPFNKHTPSD